MSQEYEKYKIKSYNYWDLYLHEHQNPYVGRCYAWAKRPAANLVGDMTTDERDELFDFIIPQWEKAANNLFKMDRPNVSCLGNEAPHLHWHLIPRYHSPREVEGHTFFDPRPNANWSPYDKFKMDEEFLMKMKSKIKSEI